MHIPDIPPFRKKSNDSANGSSASSSPQRNSAARPFLSTPPPSQMLGSGKLTEIPAFKPRKISTENAMQLPMGELKSATETTILKPAPSWSNVASKPTVVAQTQQQQIAASSSSSSAGGVSASGSSRDAASRPSVGGISNSSIDKEVPTATTSASTKAGNGATARVAGPPTEEEAKELAAKKNRLKQKLVKSARSVAIFSLKLKERRQREAEKAAAIAIEHAKSLAKIPPTQYGGELSLIPIEQLIQIEDLQPTPTKPGTTSNSAASSSTTARPQQQ